VAALPTGQTGTPVAAAATGTVRNTGTVGIGAIEVWRERGPIYRQGLYDAVIPGGRISGWPSTGGIYVGPGYCVRLRYWRNSSGTVLSDPEIINVAGQWPLLDPVFGIDIRALSISHYDCNVP
jgi:hypothetical protein